YPNPKLSIRIEAREPRPSNLNSNPPYSESVPRPRLVVPANRSPAAAEILIHHLLLLLPSLFFLFFDPDPKLFAGSNQCRPVGICAGDHREIGFDARTNASARIPKLPKRVGKVRGYVIKKGSDSFHAILDMP